MHFNDLSQDVFTSMPSIMEATFSYIPNYDLIHGKSFNQLSTEVHSDTNVSNFPVKSTTVDLSAPIVNITESLAGEIQTFSVQDTPVSSPIDRSKIGEPETSKYKKESDYNASNLSHSTKSGGKVSYGYTDTLQKEEKANPVSRIQFSTPGNESYSTKIHSSNSLQEAFDEYHRKRDELTNAALGLLAFSFGAPVFLAGLKSAGMYVAATEMGKMVVSFFGKKSVQAVGSSTSLLSIGDDQDKGDISGIVIEGLFISAGKLFLKLSLKPPPASIREAEKDLYIFYHGAPEKPNGILRVDFGQPGDAGKAFYGSGDGTTAFGYAGKKGGAGVIGQGSIDLSKYDVLDLREGGPLRELYVEYMETPQFILSNLSPSEILAKYGPHNRADLFDGFLDAYKLNPDIVIMPLGDKWTFGLGEGTQIAIRSQTVLDEIAKTMEWVSSD